MKKILVIGLGLIGGSIAHNLTQNEQHYVYGYDKSKETTDFAVNNRIISEVCLNIEETVKKVDFIIIATPISHTTDIMERIDGVSLNRDVIMTDVSSVKGPVMEKGEELTNPKITFIGGHPMAGSHKKGITAAKPHLFENAIYVLLPLENTPSEKLDSLMELLKSTKSNFVTLTSDEHDEMTGVVSHFPHLIASSLVHQAKTWTKEHAFLPKLAAGGFRDITRIASSNPAMWKDIFYYNRDKMVHLLDDWIKEMGNLKSILSENDKNEMYTYLDQAKDYRDGIGEGSRGAIPAYHDIYVDIHDQKGAIAFVAHILAHRDISINNIEILEIREGITGALRLSFASTDLQNQAIMALEENHYEISKNL